MNKLNITLHAEDPLGAKNVKLGYRYRLPYTIMENAHGVTIHIDAAPDQQSTPFLLAGKIPCFEHTLAAEAFIDALVDASLASPSRYRGIQAFLARIFKEAR